MRQNKRRSERVPVTLDVTHAGRGRVTSTRATNLSSGGMQLRVMGMGIPQAGDRLALEFMLPDPPTRVLCEAEVVYEQGDVAGVRFEDVSTPLRRSLDDYMAIRLAGSWFG